MNLVAWLSTLWASIFGHVPGASLACAPVPWRKHKNGIWYMGSDNHAKWQKEHLASGGQWARIFGLVSANEGTSAAYQNYDSQGATLGAGFGARGMLPRVAKLLNLPDIIPLPDEGDRYSSATVERMRGEGFASAYVCKAESLAYRERVLTAQVEAFQRSKERYAFPVSNVPLTYLLSHLAHWYPAFVPLGGWTGQDSTDVPRALSEFRRLAKEYSDKQVARGNSPVVPSEKQISIYLDRYRKHGGTHAA